jgi:sorting nexin-1/2
MMGEGDDNPFSQEGATQVDLSDPSPPNPVVPAAPVATAGGAESPPVATAFQDLDISSGPPGSSAGQPTQFSGAATMEPAGQASGAGASPDLAVTVSNPAKQGDGMSAFFTYEVTTRTSLPQYKFGQFSVTRRFRDFDWLHAQLAIKFPGAIVPPLPEKHSAQTTTLKAVGKQQSDTFLEDRRASLQRFLHHLAAHPMLHTAADLQAFLEKDDEELEAWKELSKQNKGPLYMSLATDAKSGLLSASSKLGSLFSGGDASASYTAVTDVPCQQMSNYATALQAQVASVHKHSKAYVEKHRTVAASLTGFGAALTQLSQTEASINESLSRGIQRMGECVGQISSTYNEQAERESGAFEEPMKHYVRLLSSVKSAIHCRESALVAYNRAGSSLAAKREKLEKLRASGSAKEEKISAATREVADAEEALNLSKSEYEAVTERVDLEMQRFQTDKLADFKRYCVNFIKLQLEYSSRIQQTWRELMPHLEEIGGHARSHPGVDTS